MGNISLMLLSYRDWRVVWADIILSEGAGVVGHRLYLGPLEVEVMTR